MLYCNFNTCQMEKNRLKQDLEQAVSDEHNHFTKISKVEHTTDTPNKLQFC